MREEEALHVRPGSAAPHSSGKTINTSISGRAAERTANGGLLSPRLYMNERRADIAVASANHFSIRSARLDDRGIAIRAARKVFRHNELEHEELRAEADAEAPS